MKDHVDVLKRGSFEYERRLKEELDKMVNRKPEPLTVERLRNLRNEALKCKIRMDKCDECGMEVTTLGTKEPLNIDLETEAQRLGLVSEWVKVRKVGWNTCGYYEIIHVEEAWHRYKYVHVEGIKDYVIRRLQRWWYD